MKKLIAPIILSLVFLSGCDRGNVLETVSCAMKDEQLSVAFKNPDRAKNYLKDLGERLEAGDPDASRDAGELVASIMDCL